MATPDMDVIKEVPGYCVILKAVLKSQIQQLIEQLASATNEESIILTASVADGTLSHLGSDAAKGFLEDHEDVKSQFLGFCLKSHHKRKQEQEQRDREEEMRKAQDAAAAAASLVLQQQQAQSIQSMSSMGYMPPRGPMPRFQATARSPWQQFRPPGVGLRHQPYPVTRPIRAEASPVRSPMKSPAKLDDQTIMLEPDNETSNQSATSQPSSPSSHQNMKSELGTEDANSESSSSHTEQNQEGLSLRADLSSSVSGDNSEHNPDTSVKLEAISEAEMVLEITDVEPGRPMQPQDWGANAMGMKFDPTGATGSKADMTVQQGYNLHVCDHCQKAFKCVSDLARHVLTHQRQKMFECSICQTRFTHRIALKKHSLVHMDTKCKQDTGLQQRRETTSKERVVCDHCQKVFKRNWHLTRHLLTHTGERPFECIVCHKRFNRKCTLKNHMLVHTREMPFECSVCQRQFNQKGTLNVHMLVHTAEKPFECSVCHKRFHQKSTLAHHMLAHTAEKPFECSLCDKQFSQKSTLMDHMLVHTGEKPFECSVCRERFSRKGVLKNHMWVHRGQSPFECSYCHKQFNKKHNLQRHLLLVHKEGRDLLKSISTEEHP
ncbi:zinc finger protein 436-like isoform X2 [Dreissena polymorpha]|uniref:C2H2-type domain-containing protein n=1 Tax=Dreissena polymorpha TaxID=45954 RepID=A0A9D4S991_DREPO|nr:zinc finger protein 436-like isoform X2 [Dreissena polymorpha]XP_052260364.1 zinc finger protein 436-like isoform X2 [Dreissena polymorpha]XP_052260365.1 zinc finger protein 436-like isoform X2 [Dreissena polymorpha]KAH3897374.1 hypothetical protein DPMN_021562 [Dreissena polymorpha]